MATNPREIWKKGTPLSEAWRIWATEENQNKLDKNHEFDFAKQSENKNLADGLRQLSVGILKFNNLKKEKAAAVINMKRDLVEWLTEEDLFAFGNPVLPTAERTPRLISNEFWFNAKINWESDIANDEVSTFQRIKVVSPEDFPEINIKPKIGRKSHKPLIHEAIERLIGNDPNFENKSHKIKAKLIRGYIEKYSEGIDPYGPGLGDDAIRKIVNLYFQKLK